MQKQQRTNFNGLSENNIVDGHYFWNTFSKNNFNWLFLFFRKCSHEKIPQFANAVSNATRIWKNFKKINEIFTNINIKCKNNLPNIHQRFFHKDFAYPDNKWPTFPPLHHASKHYEWVNVTNFLRKSPKKTYYWFCGSFPRMV